MNYKNYIFDLDDTLVKCGEYYTDIKEKFAVIKSKELGISQEFCMKMFSDVDVNTTALPGAFSTNRFSKALYVSSILLDLICEVPINYNDANYMQELGNEVFTKHFELLPHTIETLVALRDKNKSLFLLTKGNYDVQMTKIVSNNIHAYIPLTNIEIVELKTPNILLQFTQSHGLTVGDTVMVGDSVKDDIGSATVIGMDSVLVIKKIDDGWQKYENVSFEPTYTVMNINELLRHI